jgi:hypothetical protein
MTSPSPLVEFTVIGFLPQEKEAPRGLERTQATSDDPEHQLPSHRVPGIDVGAVTNCKIKDFV